MRKASTLTPMFRQYHAQKQAHPDAILLFRMGDFYEMFFEDAKDAARLLELTLTARGKGTDNVVPMCGFPHHQLEAYTARLVRADKKVAICDQVEDPKATKGLVRREVVRVVTPGTVIDPGQLESKENAWVCAVTPAAGRVGAAFLDVSTGEFLAWQSRGDEDGWNALADRIRSFSPREIVYAESLENRERLDEAAGAVGALWTPTDPYSFAADSATALLEKQLAVGSLDGFGLRERVAAVAAAGGLLQYILDTQKCGLEHINRIAYHEPADHLLLDPATRRNLELERSLRDAGRRGSLLDAIDATITPAGGRLLRRWLLSPLVDPARINERLDAVEELVHRGAVRDAARERLKGVHDIERLLTRAVAGSANARELLSLRLSLERIPELVEGLAPLRAPFLRAAIDGLDPCDDIASRLASALVDDPPVSLREGGVIRDGFDDEIDELRTIRRDGRAYIASLETKERQATGIGSLKVKFNKVFGYYIEVSKPNLHLVPEHYHRKQTVATGERFVTPELKEYESKVLNAQERLEALETERFQELRIEVATQAARLQRVARTGALVDVVAALAETAVRQEFCRPQVDDGERLVIVGGRHPVVEQSLVEQRFVPNDTTLQSGGRGIAILTGPNMGGKSTYLRQVALITLLAQMGSYVPAERVELGVADRVFCRVGASDSLAEGQSTFMVEMTETANILHHATRRSLLLLDEIGRGTSTFDGMSIAWAVVEHLHALAGGCPRTLFATHYHELTELAVELDSVVNLRMAVREWGERVVFLHKVEEGASDRSYGIQVARLAGVPDAVVKRAARILQNLERDEYGGDGLPRRARGGDSPSRQASLFGLIEEPQPDDFGPAGEVLSELRATDPDRLTPMQALEQVAEWRRRLQEAERPTE